MVLSLSLIRRCSWAGDIGQTDDDTLALHMVQPPNILHDPLSPPGGIPECRAGVIPKKYWVWPQNRKAKKKEKEKKIMLKVVKCDLAETGNSA